MTDNEPVTAVSVFTLTHNSKLKFHSTFESQKQFEQWILNQKVSDADPFAPTYYVLPVFIAGRSRAIGQ